MKSIALKNISFFDGEELVQDKNIIIKRKTINITDIIPDEENMKIIDCSSLIALPSLPLIKETIFDLFSYKYTNSFSIDFILDGPIFDKLPYNYLDIWTDIASEKMIQNGSYFLFLNHLCYHMVKSSLITIAMKLKAIGIKSSLSYLFNDVYPEQKIVSDKENSSYHDYVNNIKDPYLFHHYGYYFNKKHQLEDGKIIYIRFPSNTSFSIKDIDSLDDMEKTFIIKYEDPNRYFENFVRKPNLYYIIDDDYFVNKEFSNSIFSILDSKVDSHFILANGFNSFSLFNSIYKIVNFVKDIRVLKLLKNQLLILPQFVFDITERKVGYIKNDYEANLILFDTKGFSIQSFDELIDLLFIKYISNPIPTIKILEGEII
ncbi:MAG: hypothetical protein NUV32_06690 [Exilispira sp.]|jgi:hypothetical protein|nr:hypothetical protein [Exilispira sp.]